MNIAAHQAAPGASGRHLAREQTAAIVRFPTHCPTSWTYGRSLGKALDVFDLDHSKWHELAADRCAWRAMLASGTPPPAFRALPPQPAAPPLALGRARRSSAAQTDAAIAASARGDALTTTLGYVQRRAALRDITNHI